MRKSSLFKEVKNIEDIKQILENDIDYIFNKPGCFINGDTLEMAFQGLGSFPKEQEQKFVSFVKRVDKSFYSPGSYKGNAYHKYPVVIAGLMYYRYYPDKISELNLDELVLLSSFSFVAPPSFYEHAVDQFGKEMLSSIIEKTSNNRDNNMSIIMLADHIMKEDNKTKEETTEYIKRTPIEQLLEEEKQVTIEMFKNVRIPW